MPTLGKTSIGGNSSTSGAARQVVSSATASADGRLLDGRARVWLTTAATVNTRFVIYSNGASVPSTLLAQSDVLVLATGTQSEKTYTFSGANIINIVNGTIYWLGVAWDAVTTMNWNRDGTASQIQQGTITAGPTPPGSFGTPSALAGPLDAYVNFGMSDVIPRRRTTRAQLGAALCEPRM
jgi:hypothetical protein